MSIMPWLEMGWNVINVEYRMARVAMAPGAVEDAQCALRFVVNQAKNYNVDASRIVVSGDAQRFLLPMAAQSGDRTAITVVENWTAMFANCWRSAPRNAIAEPFAI